MKNQIAIAAALFASLALSACQGSNNTPTTAVNTACQQTVQYGPTGQPYQPCINPNLNTGMVNTGAYGGMYGGMNTGMYGGTGNACAVYNQAQYGIYYSPQIMQNGQMACVSNY